MGNTHTHLHRLRKQRAQRGFSLIELVVVVIIIAILAVIAIPAISKRMKDRRTSELAQRVSHIYRDARMRAMGRGGAGIGPASVNAACCGKKTESLWTAPA